jgi:hypothetical protein
MSKFIVPRGTGYVIDWQALHDFHKSAAADPERTLQAKLYHREQARQIFARRLRKSRTRIPATEVPWTWENCLREAQEACQPLLLEKKAVMLHFPHSVPPSLEK